MTARERLGTYFVWFGLAAGALSMVLLLQQALDLGFVAPLQTMLDYYKSWLTFLFGWMELPLVVVCEFLGQLVPADWRPTLRPGWDSSFVVAFLTTAMLQRVLYLDPLDRTDLGMLVFAFFVFAFSSAVKFGTKPGWLGAWIRSQTGLDVVASNILYDISSYIVVSLVITIITLVLTAVSIPSPERKQIPREEWTNLLGYLMALTFGPLLGALGFIATNAGLTLIGIQ